LGGPDRSIKPPASIAVRVIEVRNPPPPHGKVTAHGGGGEAIGTKRLLDFFEAEGVTLKVITHDRNMSINKMVKDTPYTISQNDVWHAIKNVKKAMKIASMKGKHGRKILMTKWNQLRHTFTGP